MTQNLAQERAVSRRVLWVGALFFIITSCAMRLGLLQAPGEFDEFYHLLAARGWVDSGGPHILDGTYWRGALFTRLVAVVFDLTGDQSLPTARIVSLLAGMLLPGLLFLWVAKYAGLGAALLAAGLAVLWPQGIIEAQMARFYALHVLTFFIGTSAFFGALTARGLPRLVWGVITAAGWALALNLQVSTAIGVGAALYAGGFVLALRQQSGLGNGLGNRLGNGLWIWAGLLLAPCVLLGLSALFAGDLLERAWAFYRWTPLHAEALRDYSGFYFKQFGTTYAALWLSSLVLVPLGIWAGQGGVYNWGHGLPTADPSRALALYCAVIFTLCFLVHSFGGMKALRYLSYATPFLFVCWALGLVAAFHILWRLLSPQALAGLTLLGVLGVGLSSDFMSRSWRLAGGDSLPARGDWSTVQTVVGDWHKTPFIATTRELHLIAHFGPYDVLFSPSRLSELTPPNEFGIDSRTGRPVVGQAETMARILSCVPEGLLITSPYWWHQEGWKNQILANLEPHNVVLEQREAGTVLALRWHSPASQTTPCTSLTPHLPQIAQTE